MAKQEISLPAVTPSSTKKELLDAYSQATRMLKEKREAEMKPEQRIEEKQVRAAVETADALTTDEIGRRISDLRSEVGTVLVQLSEKLEEEARKYAQLKKAVAAREEELQEICDIEKNAVSLSALIEVQQAKRQQFDADMAEQKEKLRSEIESARDEWQEEKVTHDLEAKERDTAEKKRRERETEEYRYGFEREKQLAREQFEYEKNKMELEIATRKEALEKELAERERAVVAREKALAEAEAELIQLRAQVAAFPKERDETVAKAVQGTSERLKSDAKNSEELLRREFNGEKNVLLSKIESLQQSVKEQAQQIAKISGQLEKSYGQVQDIAIKAIEGSAGIKVFSGGTTAESTRRSESA